MSNCTMPGRPSPFSDYAQRLKEIINTKTDGQPTYFNFFKAYVEVKRCTDIIKTHGRHIDSPPICLEDKKTKKQKNQLYIWVKNSFTHISSVVDNSKQKWICYADKNPQFVVEYVLQRENILRQILKLSPRGLPPAPVEETEGLPPAPVEETEGLPSAPVAETEGLPPAPVEETEGLPSAPVAETEGLPPAPVEETEGLPSAPVAETEGLPPAPVEETEGLPSAPVAETEEKQKPSRRRPKWTSRPSKYRNPDNIFRIVAEIHEEPQSSSTPKEHDDCSRPKRTCRKTIK